MTLARIPRRGFLCSTRESCVSSLIISSVLYERLGSASLLASNGWHLRISWKKTVRERETRNIEGRVQLEHHPN